MQHQIKLLIDFCEPVITGEKTFEVRKNDRGYQKGDEVIFIPCDREGNPTEHRISKKVYEITYVLSGWGIEQGFVVFSIEDTGKQIIKLERT